ncbi:MAG: hypothetical protein U0U67_03530 [Chitinophagales bacterium]
MKKLTKYSFIYLIAFTIILYILFVVVLINYDKEYDEEGFTHGILTISFYYLIPYFSIITFASYKLHKLESQNPIFAVLTFLFGIIPSISLVYIFFSYFS